jgi:hypothetical protein
MIVIQDDAVGARPQDHERRRSIRRPCDRWAALVTVAEGGKSAPYTVRAENVSTGGMAVYSWQPLEGSGALMVQRANGEMALVGAEIVYCRPRSRLDYDCGIRFTGRPGGVSLDDFREGDGKLLDLGSRRRR